MTPRGAEPGGPERPAPAWLAFWYRPQARSALYQVAFLFGLGVLLFEAFRDVRANMQARGIPTDFSFLDNVAGFDINQTLIAYSAQSTYGRAFLVGLLNTCLVGALGIVFATLVGLAAGLTRLSKNWILAKSATVYVEAFRNAPLLLQLLFWYNAVLKPLPPPRLSYALPFGIHLNNRGLFLPEPVFGPDAPWLILAAALTLIGGWLLQRFFAQSRTLLRDKTPPFSLLAAYYFWALAIVAFALAGDPLSFVFPELKGFNFVGGIRLLPEFVALVFGLSLYTGAFIAEILRAGVQSVPRGQSEAAAALGLRPWQTFRLVVAPLAMRLVIPPLTSQYLNLVKNSSLAVFIGYPDLVQVFAGTVLNQTGAAVQVIFLTMLVYLSMSLLGSLAMNLFNRRFAVMER